jgi:hypothetical protein
VPWSCFTLEPSAAALDLKVSKDQLAQAPSFDDSKWPDLSDRAYVQRVYDHFSQGAAFAAISPGATNGGTDGHTDGQRADGRTDGHTDGAGAMLGRWQKATDLEGKRVQSADNQGLGKIQNLIVDMNNDRILFAIIPGSAIDKSDQQLAVPWLACKVAADASVITIDVPKDKLKDAPIFGEKSWPNLTDPKFMQRVYSYYNVKPYWKQA